MPFLWDCLALVLPWSMLLDLARNSYSWYSRLPPACCGGMKLGNRRCNVGVDESQLATATPTLDAASVEGGLRAHVPGAERLDFSVRLLLSFSSL